MRRFRLKTIAASATAFAVCLLLIGHAQAADIPVSFVNGQPVIAVKIDGKPVRLKLDLGANLSIALDMATLRTVRHVHWLARNVTTINVNGKASVQRTFRLPRVMLGERAFADVRGVVYSPWGVRLASREAGQTKRSPIVGVIGWEFFKEGALCLSYRHRSLSLDGAASNCVGDKSRKLPLTTSADGIGIRYVLGKDTYRAVLDSGATLSLWNTAISQPPDDLAEHACGTFADGKPCKRVAVPEAMDKAGLLSGVRFILFKTRSLMSDLLLGADFFHRHDIYVDLAENQLYIGTPATKAVAD